MFELRGIYLFVTFSVTKIDTFSVDSLILLFSNSAFDESLEKTYKETIDLIAKAYTSLFEDFLCNMLNQTPDVITELCNNLGWEIQDGDYPRLILPRRPPEVKVNTESAENLLAKLTDFVSFLEN